MAWEGGIEVLIAGNIIDDIYDGSYAPGLKAFCIPSFLSLLPNLYSTASTHAVDR